MEFVKTDDRSTVIQKAPRIKPLLFTKIIIVRVQHFKWFPNEMDGMKGGLKTLRPRRTY